MATIESNVLNQSLGSSDGISLNSSDKSIESETILSNTEPLNSSSSRKSCLKNSLLTMRNVGISLVAGVGSFLVTYIEHIAETTVWCLKDESIQDSNDDKHRLANKVKSEVEKAGQKMANVVVGVGVGVSVFAVGFTMLPVGLLGKVTCSNPSYGSGLIKKGCGLMKESRKLGIDSRWREIDCSNSRRLLVFLRF